jgi:TfoX/Sxy family transcriptional regulator of competence genes
MAYDEGLAERIRGLLEDRAPGAEKRMFGGLAFLVRGHMAVGLSGDDLMVRVGPDAHDDALRRPGARPMDFTGRPMRGYVFVTADALESDRDLGGWIDRAVAFVSSLPPKQRRPTPPAARRPRAAGTRTARARRSN